MRIVGTTVAVAHVDGRGRRHELGRWYVTAAATQGGYWAVREGQTLRIVQTHRKRRWMPVAHE
jgi:hypothetical protein